MSKIGVNFKIDVTKLDKSRFFKGQKGTYVDLTCFIDPENPGEHGDHGFITQQQTKEERDNKQQMPILGNVKVFWKEDQQQAHNNGMQQMQQPPPQQAPPAQDNFDDDIPF
jgi:hypothetical protein